MFKNMFLFSDILFFGGDPGNAYKQGCEDVGEMRNVFKNASKKITTDIKMKNVGTEANPDNVFSLDLYGKKKRSDEEDIMDELWDMSAAAIKEKSTGGGGGGSESSQSGGTGKFGVGRNRAGTGSGGLVKGTGQKPVVKSADALKRDKEIKQSEQVVLSGTQTLRSFSSKATYMTVSDKVVATTEDKVRARLSAPLMAVYCEDWFQPTPAEINNTES
jgi:hypothetical protein